MLTDFVERIHAAALENRRIWVATVISSQGSTPGKPGMKMIVYPDGSTAGTVGGGQVEKDVIAEILAQRPEGLARRTFEMGGDFSSKPGMACGGSQEVLIEPFGSSSRLYVIGAGHCAMELSALAGRCGFSVTVIDDRPDWANKGKHPLAAVSVCRSYSGLDDYIDFSDQAYIVIMTHQHLHDEEALRACLRRKWSYLGMIGSRRKVGLLFDKLASEGVGRELLAGVHSPIGFEIGSQTPAEIAVSIAAQLIAVRNGAGANGTEGKRVQ